MSTTPPQIRLYYFSGTGNAKRVALWMREEAAGLGGEVTLVDVAHLSDRKHIPPPAEGMVGFCCPTHGFNYPPIMLHFIFRFPRKQGGQAFLLNTRAGMKMGKLFLPGLSGMALYLNALVLRLKGYRIRGLRPIDLPSNWISLHPGIRKKVVVSIFDRRKKDVTDFTRRLLAGKRVWRGLRGLVPDLLITPIGVLYYLIGRFALAKTFFASRDCSDCGLCRKQCPVGAIKKVEGRCFWTMQCESCMKCLNSCPDRAIETGHGFFIGASFLIYGVALYWLHQSLHLESLLEQALGRQLGQSLVTLFNGAVYLALLLPFYRLVHFLLGFRIFERLFTYTSLTHYTFWRRYTPPRK